jgi:hypothetical protein
VWIPAITLGARSRPLAFLLRGSRPIVDPERGKQIVETQVSQDIGGARMQDGRAIAAARNKEPRSRTWGALFASGVSPALLNARHALVDAGSCAIAEGRRSLDG